MLRRRDVSRTTALVAAGSMVAAVALLAVGCAGTGGEDVVTSAGSTGASAAGPAARTGSTTTTPAASMAPASTTTADPRTQIGSGQPVTLVFGGDIHYNGTLATLLATSPSTMLRAIEPVLGSGDLSIVNLETAIGTSGSKATKKYNFIAPPAAFDALKSAGIGVISMANNHALDYGQAGLSQTLAAIAAKQAPVIGIGHDEAEAYRPFTATINGQRISVIAATQIIDSALVTDWTATATHPGLASAKRVDRLVAAVRAARAASDTVVVFLHWGTESTYCPNAAQLALAPQLVAAGADIVVGSHAHRVLSGGYLGDAYVEYGLGNLQFEAGAGDGAEIGLLELTVTGRRIDASRWVPARIGADHLPVPLEGAAAAAATARWDSRRGCAKLSATLGGPLASGDPDTNVPDS